MLKSKSSANVVAICWDARQFHFMLARTKSSSIQIVKSVSSLWQNGFSASELSAQVSQTLKESKVRNADLLIGIARSQADVYQFDLPPASDAELPNLVMTGIAQQSGEMPDDDSFDYTVRNQANDSDNEKSTSGKSIEAVVLRRETKSDLEQLKQHLFDKPKAIVLRSLSVASLFRRTVTSQKNCLVVNRLDESADFLVFEQDQVVFQRTVRFEAEQDLNEQAASMSDEILRTLASAPHEPSQSGSVQRIFLFGIPEKDDRFVTALEQELTLPVSLVSPFDGIDAQPAEIQDLCPYAALVGMVRDYQDNAIAIDFANPKKPPKAPNRLRQAVFYTAAAVITLGLLAWHFTEPIRVLRQSNDELQTQIDTAMNEYKMLRRKTLVVDEIAKWRRDEINWLDELRDISRRFPKSSEAVVDRMSLGGNRVSMSVRGSNQSIVNQLESKLRDHPYRHVSRGPISKPVEKTDFPCQFESTLTIAPRRPKNDYLKPLAVNKNKAAKPIAEVAGDVR